MSGDFKGLKKEKTSNTGRPSFEFLLMFGVLIRQSLYNLADGQTEFQIRDRVTFLRFLGLTPESRNPEEKTDRANDKKAVYERCEMDALENNIGSTVKRPTRPATIDSAS
ncbi:MAG: transposase [Acidiferrobacterales bacterium]